jgi:2-phosphoglycolate phosphatase
MTEAILLDLDGTLVDTAPDLVGVLNTLLREDARPPLPYAVARNVVSNGAIGLLRRGYGEGLEEPELARLRVRFLETYADNICNNSRLFIALDDLFNSLYDIYSTWGIVTNKPKALTNALLDALGIASGPDCVVSGDDLPERKPSPAPLHHAARLLGVDSSRCVYVGDALRDIEAGKAAGMKTVIAAYGYIPPGVDVQCWGADAIVQRPAGLRGTLALLRERERT